MIAKEYLSKRILYRLEPFIREDVKEIVMNDFYKEFCEWERQELLTIIRHYKPEITDIEVLSPEKLWLERVIQLIDEEFGKFNSNKE